MSKESQELLNLVNNVKHQVGNISIEKNESIYLKQIVDNLEQLNKTMASIDITLQNWSRRV